jgi:glyoxylase-like metal-dependent hydrolase (beta-lactamase superfamily II)
MKFITAVLAHLVALLALSLSALAESSQKVSLEDKSWIHGAPDCDQDGGPAMEVYEYRPDTYILRQNKCMTFEAPFMYLLVGDEKALLFDTGAMSTDGQEPLLARVRGIIGSKPLLVAHSHNHSDHYSGDAQFEGRPDTVLVPANKEGPDYFFAPGQWPAASATLDLGNRELTVIPTPGHQEEALTIYDPATRWLLTGDTLYPGLIYVKDWDAYRGSIARLNAFTEENKVEAVMGAHIEMSVRSGELYPLGTTYQPEEAALPLSPALIKSLAAALDDTPSGQQLDLGEFIVQPMNPLQKTMSNVARWLFL